MQAPARPLRDYPPDAPLPEGAESDRETREQERGREDDPLVDEEDERDVRGEHYDRYGNRVEPVPPKLAYDAAVLVRGNLRRVPAASARRALPPLAVAQGRSFTAVALVGDRRAAHAENDCTTRCLPGSPRLKSSGPGGTFAVLPG